MSVAVVVVLIASFLGAWAVDSSRQSGLTARGLTLAGRSISGLTEPQLRTAVADLASSYEDAWVVIDSPAGTVDQTAAGVGLRLDQEAVVRSAMQTDEQTNAIVRPFAWVRSLVASGAVPLTFVVDPSELATATGELAAANRVEVTEPAIAASADAITIVDGIDGQAIDTDALAGSLVDAAEQGGTPIRVEALPAPVAPRFTTADARAVADRATAVSSAPLVLETAGTSATVVSSTLRTWLTSTVGPTGLALGADEDKIAADLPALVGDIGVAPVPASFTVVPDGENPFGRVQIVDGQLGLECCAPDSASRVATALLAGEATTQLDLWPVGPAHDKVWAEGLGIVEPIGSFTTNHPPGEPRVINIHRIADIVRGMVIEPGEVFSLNERVGQRTAEKGFVEAGVIYDDQHTTDIGGGVSQFATTTFNAAFFSGLEFDEYQSHTEIFSRYPTGREATVSWPSPDLKIRNTTPYGILVWTSYTDTSVTVTMYSTPWVSGAQTGQTSEPKGPCTRYSTERTRTWVDGHSEIDHVYGVYAPGPGIRCG